MKAVLWILSILSLSVLGTWLLYQPVAPAAEEVTSSHPSYIPAYNGTSAHAYNTPHKPKTEKTEALSLIVSFLLFLGLMLFFAPMFIACKRDHPNAVSITIVNVFLGWTLVGWVIALAWACNATAPRFPKSVTPIAATMVAPTPATMDYY